MPVQFAFVSADSRGKTTTADKSLVRSHCMQGKNKRAGSRRTLQQARRLGQTQRTATATKDSQCRHSEEPKQLASPPSTQASAKGSPDRMSSPEIQDVVARVGDINRLRLTSLDISTATKTREVQEIFWMFGSIVKVVYPVHRFVQFESVDSPEYRWLMHDNDFFHSMSITVLIFNDMYSHGRLTAGTKKVIPEMFSKLNKRLSIAPTQMVDSTLYIILNLAAIAVTVHDFSSAEVHITALSWLLEMRGGIEYLRGNPSLHFKLDRLVLCWYLNTGRLIRFPAFEYSETPIQRAPRPVKVDGRSESALDLTFLDPSIASIFRDVQELVLQFNGRLQEESRLTFSEFQKPLSIVQVRLLYLDLDPGATFSKAIQLALLAFLGTTYTLPGNQSLFAKSEFLRLLPMLDVSSNSEKALLTWVLIIALMTSVPPNNLVMGSLVDMVAALPSWDEMKELLSRILWIPSIHDKAGQAAFESASAVRSFTDHQRHRDNSLLEHPGTQISPFFVLPG